MQNTNLPFPGPSFSRVHSSGYFLLEVCKRHRLSEKCKMWMWCRVHYQWNACQCFEHRLDLYHANNGVHFEIYSAYKELPEVQCFKMYWFLQYTLISKVHDVSCYCHLRPGILYVSFLWQISEFLEQELENNSFRHFPLDFAFSMTHMKTEVLSFRHLYQTLILQFLSWRVYDKLIFSWCIS
jgi:hypothetical protein